MVVVWNGRSSCLLEYGMSKMIVSGIDQGR